MTRGGGGEWFPRAAQACAEAARVTVTCGCGREFATDRRNPETHCTVCTLKALRDSVERMKAIRRNAGTTDLRGVMRILDDLKTAARDDNHTAYQDALARARAAQLGEDQIVDAYRWGRNGLGAAPFDADARLDD